MDFRNLDKRQLVTILICFVGTFLLSVLRVTAPESSTTTALGDINAYASLEDAGIFASIMALGTPWGVIASVLGIVLGDIVMGSKYFIIGNLLVKSVMGLFIAAFAAQGVSLKSVVQLGETDGKSAHITFVTHAASEFAVRDALEKIESLDCVNSVERIIRVEE